jgi:hypothetical protein
MANRRTQHIARRSDLDVALRDYLQVQIDAMEQRSLMRYHELHDMIDRRIVGVQTAVDKAENALNVRLEGMNELRSQMGAQRAEFATNDKLDALDRAMRAQFVVAQDRADRDQKLTNDDIRTLRESRSGSTAAGVTAREFMSYGVAIVAIIATVLSRFL